MRIRLHKNARTTPAVRQEIRDSEPGARALAKKHGISRTTARKWKHRDSVADASHQPHTLHTAVTPAEEAVMVYSCRFLLMPLDDLLSVTRAFLNPAMSHSVLDRFLRRDGVAFPKTLLPLAQKALVKPFKAYKPGFLHVAVKYLPAIDSATQWMSVALKPIRTARSADAFLKAAVQAAPFVRIQKCLTDTGSAFTDRFLTRIRQPSGMHEFARLCTEQAIEHRLTPPCRPQFRRIGRAFRWPHRGGVANPSVRSHGRSGEYLVPLCRAL